MKEAEFYNQLQENKVQCFLCPHNCIIANGKLGICKVRKNIDGKLYAENYGLISSLAFDPIEKKPLYHFFPAKEILSIGTVGCNLICKFCQNADISQNSVSAFPSLSTYSSGEIIKIAKSKTSNIGIAFTYNEPIIWYEYIIETARKAKSKGLSTVMVSNGFINEAPLKELVKHIDAFNIDLKAFTNSFYKNYTSSWIEPVKESLKIIKESKSHLEITNLVIPGLNDDFNDFENMINWISNELGKDIPLHISRYFPRYKLQAETTPLDTLQRCFDIASAKLDYVFMGNVRLSNGSNTICPACRKTLISRTAYSSNISGINSYGNCIYCNKSIINPDYVSI